MYPCLSSTHPMKESIRQRLEKMTDRFEEVGRLLTSAEVAGNSTQFRDLSMEYARLQPLAERFRGYHGLERDLASAQEMLADPDAGMRSLGAEELTRVKGEIEASEADLRRLLLPKDPRDDKNIYLEVRAGTGGDEAAIFAGDLFRMYARWAEVEGLYGRDPEREPRRARRLQGNHQPHRRTRRVLAPEIRVRRASRAARAGDRSPGTYPYVGLHRRHPSGNRRSRVRSTSIRRICAPTPIAPPAPAASTSTRPTRPCASPTFRPASSWSARTSAPNTRTAPRRWPC